MTTEVQLPISAAQLMDQMRGIAREAGKEGATEAITDQMQRSFREQEARGDTTNNSIAKSQIAEFKRELRRGLRENGGTYVGRRKFTNEGTANVAKALWAIAKGGYNGEHAKAIVEGETSKDGNRWAPVAKTLQAANFTSGGGLIQGETSNEFIEALYAANVALSMGAMTVSLANGPVDLNKQNQTPVFYWVGEGQAITVSEPSFGKIILSEKVGAVLVPISERLLEKLPAGMEAIIEQSMMAVMNNGLDAAYFAGAGSANTPKGLYHWTAADQILGAADYVEGATASLADVTTALLSAWYQPQKANIPGLRYGWAMHPRPLVYMMSLRTADGFHVFLDELRNGRLYGDPVGVTTNISNTLGAGSDETRIFFGDWSQFVIGQGQDVRVSRGQGVSFVDGNGNTVHGFQEGVELIKVQVGTDAALMHSEAFSILDNNQWGSGFDL